MTKVRQANKLPPSHVVTHMAWALSLVPPSSSPQQPPNQTSGAIFRLRSFASFDPLRPKRLRLIWALSMVSVP